MNAAVATLVSASLLIALVTPSVAAGKREAYRGQYVPPSVISPEQKRRNADAYERGEYYEHDSNALPFGSRAWREQKRREAGG